MLLEKYVFCPHLRKIFDKCLLAFSVICSGRPEIGLDAQLVVDSVQYPLAGAGYLSMVSTERCPSRT